MGSRVSACSGCPSQQGCCSVQLLSRVWLFMTPRTTASQASMSVTNSRSLLKLISMESIQPSHPLLSPSPPAFNPSQHQGLFQWVSSSHQVATRTGASSSTSVLPKNIQDWFPSGLTGWIFLQSKGLSSIFYSTTVQRHQFFFSFLYGPILTSIHDYWKNHGFD